MPFEGNVNFYESILDKVNAGIAVFDLEQRYIYVNRFAIRDPEIRKWIIGKTDFEYCEFRGRDKSLAENRRVQFQRILDEKKEVEWEEEFQTPSGTIHYLHRLNPLYDKSGIIKYVIGYGIEITDRKIMEDELMQSKELNRQIIDKTPHSIFVKDAEGRFLLVNKALADSFRIGKEQLINKKNTEVHSIKKETDSYSLNDQEVIKNKNEIRVIESFTHSDGSISWFDTIKVPLSLPDGNVHVLGISTDITKSKLVEEELKMNQMRMNEAQQLAHFGNWEFDLLTQTISWSDELFRMFGIKTGKAPGYEEYISLIHPEDREMILEKIERAIVHGEPYKIDHRIVLYDQSVKAIHAIGQPFKNEMGKVIKLFGTALEVTDRKKIEAALVLAKQQAEDSARIKEVFLANVSHELRTPINGILGMSGLIYKTKIDSIQRNYLDILRTTAEHLLIIVNDILDYSKIESGKLTIEKIPFNLKDTVTTAIQTQVYKAEEKDLALNLFLPAQDLPLVIGDPFRLNQILLNLLSNAIKFTETGTIDLNCSVIRNDVHDIEFEFSVRDSGIGIASDIRDHIFESFTQGSSSTSRQYGGSGLGLTICRNLVEMQGGRIWVHSQPGNGSDFRFVISYAKSEQAVMHPGPTKLVEFTSLGKLKILLAEDNRVNQFITEAMLQDWGFVVDTATNGREAIALFTANNYDIVLMDIQMPDLNGIEATHLIRTSPDLKKSKVPIIALTANTSRVMHKKYLAEGISDLLIKPYKEVTLFGKIESQILTSDPSRITVLQRPRFPARRKPATHQQSLYDLSLLKNDSHNNPAFIKRMLSIFIETIPSIIIQMKNHFQKNEIDSICSLAHKIKPTLDGAGIISLKDTIRNIEGYRDKKRTRDQLSADIIRLEEVINKIVESFAEEIKKIEKL